MLRRHCPSVACRLFSKLPERGQDPHRVWQPLPSEPREGRWSKEDPFHKDTVTSFWVGVEGEALGTHPLLQVRPLCLGPKIQEGVEQEESGKQLSLRLLGQPPVMS